MEMEILIVLGYVSICIAVFAAFGISPNRINVPAASIGGAFLVFVLVQTLNYYHPYTDTSGRYLIATEQQLNRGEGTGMAATNTIEPGLVAWFEQNSRLRLEGAQAEVIFDSIPGKVFSARIRAVLPLAGEYLTRGDLADPVIAKSALRIPVLVDVTDPRFEIYQSHLGGGSHAETAVYGERLGQLAVVRKTLLRMSAWLNYLTPVV